MEFGAKAIERFDIIPGDWYSGDLFKLSSVLRFVPNGPIDLALRSGRLWGETGFLSLRTASLIVVYEPRISLSLVQEDYERSASWWSGSAGLSIGPFSFGASAGGSREDVRFDASRKTITAADTTGIPKIMATVADVYPDLE